MEHLMDAEGKSRVSARDEPPFVRSSFLTTSPFNVGHSDLGVRAENVTVGEFWLNVDADCGSEWSHRGVLSQLHGNSGSCAFSPNMGSILHSECIYFHSH